MATNVVMPQLGESVVEGTVGKWFKGVGDRIEQYEPIMEVVTDKVTTEIPSPSAGTLLQVLVQEGTTVKAGTVLAVIGQPGEEIPAGATPSAAQAQLESAQPKQASAPSIPATTAMKMETSTPEAPATSQKGPDGQGVVEKKDGGAGMRLTPVVARMISEFNITSEELKSINGSGEGGRVSKKDLENFLKTRGAAKPTPQPELAPWEQPGTGELFRPTEEIFAKPVAPAKPGAEPSAVPTPSKPTPSAGEEIVPLTQMRRSIAEHMVRSKHTAPHVTSIHEVDMSRVIEHMKAHQEEFTRHGSRLTYTPYFVQAAVAALQAMPIVNAQYTDQGIITKHSLNIGIAVAIEDGLIVPVIRNADEKSLLGLARAVNDLAARARDKKLTPDDVQGGTFSITNYGIFGSLFGTPIISQPQSAILGIGAIQKRVVVIDDAIAIRPMVYLGLTIDHRLLDGAIGDQFMNKVKDFLLNYR